VHRLVWFQGYGEVTQAIGFEKRLKRWRRDWKIRLIEEDNPAWDDLYLQSIAPQADNSVFMGPGQSLRDFRDDTQEGKRR
jgi:hypothetical protein